MSAQFALAPAVTNGRFDDFLRSLGAVIETVGSEQEILERAGSVLGTLVAHDDWLPEAYAEPDAQRYRQYLLYRDPDDRFSVVSFVWGPGQATPVHSHTVWGLVGVLRGAELAERFFLDDGDLVSTGEWQRLVPGDVEAVSPRVGDIHRVANAFDDRVSISIHVYGADIGKVERATFDANGLPKPFISGYADLPPLVA